jgi:hypothetical protein
MLRTWLFHRKRSFVVSSLAKTNSVTRVQCGFRRRHRKAHNNVSQCTHYVGGLKIKIYVPRKRILVAKKALIKKTQGVMKALQSSPRKWFHRYRHQLNVALIIARRLLRKHLLLKAYKFQLLQALKSRGKCKGCALSRECEQKTERDVCVFTFEDTFHVEQQSAASRVWCYQNMSRN